MRWSSIATVTILLCVGKAYPLSADQTTTAQPGEPTATFKDENVLAEFDVEKQCEMLIVPVTIDGRDYPFILDTGSSYCVVDTSLQPLVAKTGLRTSINGKAGFDVYKLPESRLGPVQIPAGIEAISLDMVWWRAALGRKVRGVLGMNVLKAHVVRIDCDSGKVQFLKHGPTSADAEFAMSYSARGIPVIETAFLTNKSARFLVDSGLTSAGALKSKTFDELWQQNCLTEPGMFFALKAEGFSFERHASMKLAQRDRFPPRQRFFLRGDIYNVFGLGFLSAYDVTLDFPNECLYLQRGKRLAKSLLESSGGVPSEYEKVFIDYQESIRLDPKDADGYVERGSEWLEKRQYRKAITDCSKAIRLNPKCRGAFLVRGLAKLKLDENFNSACQDIEEYQRLLKQELDYEEWQNGPSLISEP